MFHGGEFKFIHSSFRFSNPFSGEAYDISSTCGRITYLIQPTHSLPFPHTEPQSRYLQHIAGPARQVAARQLHKRQVGRKKCAMGYPAKENEAKGTPQLLHWCIDPLPPLLDPQPCLNAVLTEQAPPRGTAFLRETRLAAC